MYRVRLVSALLRIGLKTGPGLSQSLGIATAIVSLLSTVMHVSFQHCITLKRQRLLNSKFNIQFTMNFTENVLSLAPTTKIMSVISEMDTYHCILRPG